MTNLSRRRLLPLLLLSGVAACTQTPKVKPVGPPPAAAPATEIDAIVQLLNGGDVEAAKKRLKPILKRNPDDASARVLQDSIDKDPLQLLGPQSFGYTTKAGDTMLGLAKRFLGTELKSYQLARYNKIANPSTLGAGTTLRIPGEPPRIVLPPEPRPEPSRPEPKPTRPTKPKPGAPSTPGTPPVSAPKPSAPAANPAAAAHARAAGLAALNQGKVGPAVALLRRAQALDPGNPLIARDLARAERIARTVQAHH